MMSGVAITGLGALTGLGDTDVALFAGLLAGQSASRSLSALSGTPLDVGPLVAVSLPGEDNRDGHALLSSAPRTTAFLRHVAGSALVQAGLASSSARESLRVGVCVATTLGEKAPWLAGLATLHRDPASLIPPVSFGCALPAEQLAKELSASRIRVISTACCSSNSALGLSLNWLRNDLCDVVLCGGVDVLQPFVVSGFRLLRAQSPDICRPFDLRRSGVNLGEAAACVVLESERLARARGQQILARLVGAGLSQDAHHMTAPDPQGRGALLAMQRALSDANLPVDAIDFVSSHGTGTPFNDQMEARAIKLLFGERSRQVPVNSIKGSVGHTLGAAGILEAVMATHVLRHQLIPATVGLEQPDPSFDLDLVMGVPRAHSVRYVLSTTSGFGGENASVVLAAGDEVGVSRR
jgi:3-oxoacyl-[acyl-carrier-protein] synthase II